MIGAPFPIGENKPLSERPINRKFPCGDWRSLILCVLVCCFCCPVPGQPRLLDNFEEGTGKWSTRSEEKPNRKQPLGAVLPVIVPRHQTSSRCGLFLVSAAQSGEVVRFVFPVDGERFVKEKIPGLSLWLLGDGSASEIFLVLAVYQDGKETLFRCPLRLPDEWERRELYWSQFVSEDGLSVGPFLSWTRELRLEKVGPFLPFFFFIDDLTAVEPLPGPKIVGARLVVDFRTVTSINGLRWGTNFASENLELLEDPRARKWLAGLSLGWVRIQMDEVARQGSLEVALARIQRWAQQVQGLRMVPVVNLSPRSVEDLTSGIFEAECQVITQRLSPTVRLYEIFQRPREPPLRLKPEMCADYFQRVMTVLKRSAPNIQIGGVGESAAWRERLTLLLSQPFKPDFLSVHFYGSRLTSTSDDELMAAARWTVPSDLPDQVPLTGLVDWLKRLFPPKGVPLAVTECAVNWQKGAQGEALDQRVSSGLGVAWLVAVFCQLAGKAEALLQYKVSGGGWGLLNSEAIPTPLYWALWVCQTYFPVGTALVSSTTSIPGVLCLAGSTATARNLLLVNTTADIVDLKVEVLGALPAKTMRLRQLRGGETPSYQERTPTASLSLKLLPYDVRILQFVL
ncbi:MAG: hypothetical protein NZ959_00440 [Armatimonadetes bacterium]|nr:hypothetical protein [Armatimonadota bacterium]MDW8120782.1 hypothetical protein [Armatimonadota bacterium]